MLLIKIIINLFIILVLTPFALLKEGVCFLAPRFIPKLREIYIEVLYIRNFMLKILTDSKKEE